MPKTFVNIDGTVVDKFIYSQFITYIQLKDITPPLLVGLKDKLVNVFIDLYSMLIPLYTFYNYSNSLSLTACLVNAAIHYRNYFRKFGIYTNIFLYYSPTMSSNNLRYCPEYNKSNNNKILHNIEVRQLVDQNLALLGVVAPYLPDIYFRIGTVETPIMAVDTMMNFISRGFDTNCLFVTSSPIAFQIPVLCPKATIFCRRHNGEVLVVNRENVLEQALHYTKNQPLPIQGLDPSWISGFYTLCGLSKRNIKSLMSYKTAFNVFKRMLESGATMNPDAMYQAYVEVKEKESIDLKKSLDLIHNRFKCFDFVQQLAMYKTMPESKETAYLTQLQDWEELLHLNDQYFRDNPMQLDKL